MTSQRTELTVGRQMLLAASAIASGVLLRLVLEPVLQGTQVWLTFWPAAFLAAWFGGWRAGVATVAVSTSIVFIWVVPGSVLDVPRAVAGGIVFAICGLGFCFVAHVAQRHEREERRLRDGYLVFAEALSNAKTSADVADALAGQGGAILAADVSACARITDGDSLELLAARGLPDTIVVPAEFPLTLDGPLCVAIRTGKPHYVETAAEFRERFSDVAAVDKANRAAAALPLVVGERIVGSAAFRFARERRFSEPERALLLTLVSQAAQAFERANLFNREVAANRRMRGLVDLATVLASSESLNDVGRAVVTEGARSFGADSAVLYAREEIEDVYRMIAERGGAPDVAAELGTIAIESERGRKLATEQWVEDLEQYREQMPEFAQIASTHRRPVAFWSIPLVAEGASVGVLGMGFYQPQVFPADEREFVRLFARHCAQAVARALRKRSAEAANRAKDEFLAMLGHELRNPLAPITTALELIEMKGLQSSERALAIIRRQVKHLTKMVDDLLDVSRIRAGKVQLERMNVETGAIIASAIEMVAPLIAERKHRVVLECADIGLPLHADVARIRQVLTNILTNAAKYTDPGGEIRIAARRDGGEVVLDVTDSGVGIAPQLQPHVFDLFTQEQQSADRSRGGLGLGLAIARTFVLLHDGTISVHSEGKNAGTRISIRLPLAATVDVVGRITPLPPELAAGAGRRVLVVDDNRDAADMLVDLAELRGHATRRAHDGITALLLLEPKDWLPDVALLDIGLPEMNGYELAQRIRQIPELARIRLVAVTGYGQDGDRARSRAAGFDLHLVKPLQLDELIRAIEEPVVATQSATSRATAGTPD